MAKHHRRVQHPARFEAERGTFHDSQGWLGVHGFANEPGENLCATINTAPPNGVGHQALLRLWEATSRSLELPPMSPNGAGYGPLFGGTLSAVISQRSGKFWDIYVGGVQSAERYLATPVGEVFVKQSTEFGQEWDLSSADPDLMAQWEAHGQRRKGILMVLWDKRPGLWIARNYTVFIPWSNVHIRPLVG